MFDKEIFDRSEVFAISWKFLLNNKEMD